MQNVLLMENAITVFSWVIKAMLMRGLKESSIWLKNVCIFVFTFDNVEFKSKVTFS